MSYYANGKTYTDHPLMDEMCYNCKRILKGIVIKNDVLANSKETENSLTNAEMYYIYTEDGAISFEAYPFDIDVLQAYYGDLAKASMYSKNKNLIPESDRKDLMIFANQYFIDRFEEENDYYRMLMGLPPFEGKKPDGSNEYDIFLVEEDLPNGYNGPFDPHKPLHEQDRRLLQVLYSKGVIDQLREIYVGSNYSYMLYLGPRSIDLYKARKAAKWDILYIPNVYYLIEDKFTDIYNTNRIIYSQRSYQEFFNQTGDYYDQLMILIVLAETFSNLVTDVPEWYIRRDIFDLRSCQYFLESYGVKYYSVIPLKYQIRIVKKLNQLIKYKSSMLNMHDIIDIFGIDDVYINRYWLYKEYDNETDDYDLEFVSSKMEDSYDEYMEDANHRVMYNDITLFDKYWDGEDSHTYVKEQILNQEFTVRGTKYLSVEYHVSLSEYLYQMAYMLGSILDSNLDLSDITIPIPTIDDSSNFRLSDLFLYLVVLTNSYDRKTMYDDSTKIRVPDDITEGPEPPINEEFYDYKKKYFPFIYVKKNGRILGFNNTLDKFVLRTELRHRHSIFRFGAGDTENAKNLVGGPYIARADEWIDKLKLDDFIVGDKISSIEELMNYYNTSTDVYDNLKKARLNAQNDDQKRVLEYYFQELFTKEFDTEFYKLSDGSYASDLVEILKDKDYILYSNFMTIMTESNMESRQELIRNVMNDIIDTLEYYFYDQGVDYLFSFTTTQSFFAIVQYIYLMLNFFKSYKVYFLDPYFTFEADDIFENSARPMDNIEELKLRYWHWDKLQVQDIIDGFGFTQEIKESAFDNRRFEAVDIYAHNEFDPLSDYNYDGKTAEEASEESFTIDGRNAKDEMSPYVMVNGGASYLGNLDWENIDGSCAFEYPNRDYYSIDGGYAYNEDDNNTDAMGSQLYNFEIDGGSSSGRNFINNSLETYFISDMKDIRGTEKFELDSEGRRIIPGTSMFSNVVLSPRSSERYIKVLEDGLYMGESDFVLYNTFNNLVESTKDLMKIVSEDGAKALADIKVLKDIEALEIRIKSILSSITYDMEYANNQLADDYFIKRNISAVYNMLVAGLLSRDINPYSWEELG